LNMNENPSISFIGGGRITWLLLESLHRKGALAANVVVSDPDPEARRKVGAISESIACTNDNEAAARSDVVFLAVHPPALKQVSSKIANSLSGTAIVVSLAPKVKMKSLTEWLDGFGRLARMIPNAASIVHRGYNPVAFSSSLSPDKRKSLVSLFETWGRSPEVDEDKLEAYAILTAMGPTYFWFQWLELKRLGIRFGLSEDEIKSALPTMLDGAAEALFASGLTEDSVMDLVPIHPLKDKEASIRDAYQGVLEPLHRKLTT
jgi:pyrroline-5-carboxylate reductase